MSKRRMKLKTAFLTSLILVSVLLAVTPTTTAQTKSSALGLTNLSSLVEVNWSSFEETIVPKGSPAKPQIRVEYNIAKGGFFPGLQNFFFRFYQGERIDINLEIVNQPEWSSVSLSTRTLPIILSDDLPQSRNVEMTISLVEDAPAFEQGIITIKASVPNVNKFLLPELKGFEKSFDLTFTPEYLPVIDARPKGSNTENIGPMDTAVFPVEVTNLGNERSQIFFYREDIPDGWKVIMTDTMILDSQETKTAYLTIQPPRGFGYHYDIEDIAISVQPARALNPTVKGEKVPVTVQVESRGISLVGGEIILPPIIALVVIIIVIIYYFSNKNKDKNKKNNWKPNLSLPSRNSKKKNEKKKTEIQTKDTKNKGT